MERVMTMSTAKNGLQLYSKLYREYVATIEMLEDMLKDCSNGDKRYKIIVDEIMGTTKSAHGIKQYIEAYENFIKEHEDERNFNEIDNSGEVPETSD